MNTFKTVVILVLLGVCMAIPVPEYEHDFKHEKKLPPKPYSFSYGVKDEYRGTVFGQDEKSDGKEIHGSYSVQLPDGRHQFVKYRADHHNGFVADVSYKGKAIYPSKVGPPFVVKNKHHSHESYKPHSHDSFEHEISYHAPPKHH